MPLSVPSAWLEVLWKVPSVEGPSLLEKPQAGLNPEPKRRVCPDPSHEEPVCPRTISPSKCWWDSSQNHGRHLLEGSRWMEGSALICVATNDPFPLGGAKAGSSRENSFIHHWGMRGRFRSNFYFNVCGSLTTWVPRTLPLTGPDSTSINVVPLPGVSACCWADFPSF